MREYAEIPKEKPQFASPEELAALKRRPPEALTGKAQADFQRQMQNRERDLKSTSDSKRRDYAMWKDMAWDKQFEDGPKRGQHIKVSYDLDRELESTLSGKIVYIDDPESAFPYVIVKPNDGDYYYHILNAKEIELEGDTPQNFYWSMSATKIAPSKSKEPMDEFDEPWGESFSFKQFMKLQEVGTSTGDVAAFKRMTIPGQIKRQFPPWGIEDPFFKKNKKKKLLG